MFDLDKVFRRKTRKTVEEAWNDFDENTFNDLDPVKRVEAVFHTANLTHTIFDVCVPGSEIALLCKEQGLTDVVVNSTIWYSLTFMDKKRSKYRIIIEECEDKNATKAAAEKDDELRATAKKEAKTEKAKKEVDAIFDGNQDNYRCIELNLDPTIFKYSTLGLGEIRVSRNEITEPPAKLTDVNGTIKVYKPIIMKYVNDMNIPVKSEDVFWCEAGYVLESSPESITIEFDQHRIKDDTLKAQKDGSYSNKDNETIPLTIVVTNCKLQRSGTRDFWFLS